MELEKLLDAMIEAEDNTKFEAIRARILRMDEEKKDLIDDLFLRIGDREKTIRERTDRIVDLEGQLKDCESELLITE